MIGRSTTVSISLGMALVAGRNRVPRPATGNTALRIGGMSGKPESSLRWAGGALLGIIPEDCKETPAIGAGSGRQTRVERPFAVSYSSPPCFGQKFAP